MKKRNLVAKNMRQFNRAVRHKDRKKSLKQGYQKHKKPCHDAGLSVFGRGIFVESVLLQGS